MDKPFVTTTVEPTTATTITIDTTTSATTTFNAGCSVGRWRSLNPNFDATEQDDQSILVKCKSGYKLNILDGRERTKGICGGDEYVFKYENLRCTKCPEFVQQGVNGVGLLNTIKWSNGISVIFRIEIEKNDPNFLIGMIFSIFRELSFIFIALEIENGLDAGFEVTSSGLKLSGVSKTKQVLTFKLNGEEYPSWSQYVAENYYRQENKIQFSLMINNLNEAEIEKVSKMKILFVENPQEQTDMSCIVDRFESPAIKL